VNYLRLLVLSLAIAGCADRTTGKLSTALEQRFATEGIARRAADLTFRYTRDPGGRSERREDRRASIIVTKTSVYIHKNDKVGVDITPRTRRDVAVERSGDRVRIRAGRGASEEVWSFVPPDDPAGWTEDIRAVMKTSAPARK
jgi:hypothetical protein